jgi:hypothetical protein
MRSATIYIVYAIYILAIALWATGCTHKPFTPLATPPATATTATTTTTTTVTPSCDTANISYSGDIQPIFASNCYTCHGDTVVTTGLNLETFTTLKAYLQNDFRGDGLYGSMLYHCILHSQGAQRMPPSYKLDSCSIKKIHGWILAGGQNN